MTVISLDKSIDCYFKYYYARGAIPYRRIMSKYEVFNSHITHYSIYNEEKLFQRHCYRSIYLFLVIQQRFSTRLNPLFKGPVPFSGLK